MVGDSIYKLLRLRVGHLQRRSIYRQATYSRDYIVPHRIILQGWSRSMKPKCVTESFDIYGCRFVIL